MAQAQSIQLTRRRVNHNNDTRVLAAATAVDLAVDARTAATFLVEYLRRRRRRRRCNFGNGWSNVLLLLLLLLLLFGALLLLRLVVVVIFHHLLETTSRKGLQVDGGGIVDVVVV
jgi:hypothetical protein